MHGFIAAFQLLLEAWRFTEKDGCRCPLLLTIRASAFAIEYAASQLGVGPIIAPAHILERQGAFDRGSRSGRGQLHLPDTGV